MNYPVGINKTYGHKIGHKNRGMTLENEINYSNEFYLTVGRASIYKKPTPIRIVKVDYPSRSETVIKEAYFITPSTTDYNGIYRGKYIDFEAKETRNLNFPLVNIHKHQVKHLKTINDMGGIGFIIVRFTKTDETFLLDINDFLSYTKDLKIKSIPKKYFEEKGHIISMKFNPRLDYLKIVDQVYFKGVKNENGNL